MNCTFFQTPNEYFHKNANTWLEIEVDFSELCRNVNKRIIQSRRLCGTDSTSVSHNNNNINKIGWQAHYLCVSAASSVWQTRCKLKCTICPADILKICRKQPQWSFSSFFEELSEFSSPVFFAANLCQSWCEKLQSENFAPKVLHFRVVYWLHIRWGNFFD